MNSSEKVSMNLILADVLQFVDDAGFWKGFAEGWYLSQVQSSLEKLALTTFFDVRTADRKLPKLSLQDTMPKDCFNIREMYAWNGCFSPKTSAIIHFKRLYNNKSGGRDYTALRKGGGEQQTDPFF